MEDVKKIATNAYNAQIRGDYRLSIRLYKNAIKYKMSDESKGLILYNIGNAYMSLKDYKSAIPYLKESAEFSGKEYYLWDVAISYLNLLDWNKGKEYYHYRYADNNNSPTCVIFPKLPIPKVRNLSEYKDKSVLVFDEQGLGDKIMFASKLEEFSKLVKNATVQVSYELIELFESEFRFDNIKYKVFQAISIDDVKNYDCYMGLGDIFMDLYQIGEPIYNREFKKSSNKKIGITWSANKKSPNSDKRSIPIKKLNFINKFDAVSLQMGEGREIGLEDYNPKDILETWNLMNSLDLVITIDSMVAHLAGMKGIDTILIINKHLDWRWKYVDDNFSKFYPNIEIISINDNIEDIINDYLN